MNSNGIIIASIAILLVGGCIEERSEDNWPCAVGQPCAHQYFCNSDGRCERGYGDPEPKLLTDAEIQTLKSIEKTCHFGDEFEADDLGKLFASSDFDDSHGKTLQGEVIENPIALQLPG